MKKVILSIEIEELGKVERSQSEDPKHVYDPVRITGCKALWVECRKGAVVQETTMQRCPDDLEFRPEASSDLSGSAAEELRVAMDDFFSLHNDKMLKEQLYQYARARGSALWLTPRDPGFEDPPEHY